MIKTEMYLFDSYERSIYFQAADLIENHRRQKMAAQGGNAEIGQRVGDAPAEAPLQPGEVDPLDVHVGPPAETPPEETAAGQGVTGTITPAGAVSMADVEAAASAFMNQHGVTKTRDTLMQHFGVGRLSQLKAEDWVKAVAVLAVAQ